MSRSYLIAARRSPIAPRNGAFAALSFADLAQPVLQQTLADAGLAPVDVDELIVSNALGAGGNPARIIGLQAGLPDHVAGLSIDRQCAGGMDALLIADAMIRSGQHDVVIAGGVETYSRRPLRSRTFADGRPPEAYDQAPFTPWPDRDPDMATAAQELAQAWGVSKADQDAWAIKSHARARATKQPEIIPFAGLTRDPFTRNLTQRLCDKAASVAGCITAANMAVAADGAAFVVMVSERWVAQRRAVAFVAGRTVGGDPEMPGTAPIAAIEAALAQARLSVADIQCAEIMEAFAVQAIACQRGAKLPLEIVNTGGGALAWGHPVGASGAVMAARLYHQLGQTGGAGIAAIAAAGGIGSAIVLRAD
ncbi:thiolase family protein [Yoonia sp. I 8.24]|uniref:thiolase family protein n=1 Tax=Yoonia sp. I 8.24 TaxID=1537229 RepID=UPI001EDF061D|nr:thiolase family protein [Yoonia sp. I 8.24]MCG3269284.1 thiolase family protein [Yoonia sp. I 8.24]